jgi:hypothetical protein
VHTTIGRNIKCKTLYISSLSPESFWMNNFVLAGLLTYTLFIAFPYIYSGMKNEQIKVFTATGIVLEFHQASLLIPIFGNHYKSKVMFQNRNFKISYALDVDKVWYGLSRYAGLSEKCLIRYAGLRV